METNRTSDVLGSTGNVVAMPSGLEVESARLHMPVDDGGRHMSGMTRPAWREKLDTMRSRSMSKMSEFHQRFHDMKHDSMSKTQNHLRTHPTMWAGAAMGAGFTLGLLGRLMLWKKQREYPEVIVISGAC